MFLGLLMPPENVLVIIAEVIGFNFNVNINVNFAQLLAKASLSPLAHRSHRLLHNSRANIASEMSMHADKAA